MKNRKGKSKLIIIGASGHGKVVLDIAVKMRKWLDFAFLDDDDSIKFLMGINVAGKTEDASKYINQADIFVAIGNNSTRQKIQQKLEAEGASIPLMIHPNSVIGPDVGLGCGTVVMAGAVINCSTKVGKGCIINTGATVDHDCFIEDYVHISPGGHVAGTVKVGQGSWLGIGSVISNNITVTCNCVIGAGSVVVKDIFEQGTYAGIPAKKV